MAMNVANLFSGFLVEDEAFFILVEFESDRMSLRKSAKSGRIGAHGLNWKIFVNFDLRFEIFDKNNFMKKNFMPLRLF